MKNGGHGLLQDVAVALAGSTLATWILQALGSSDEGVFVTSVVAFTGAATRIVAQRKLWRAHS